MNPHLCFCVCLNLIVLGSGSVSLASRYPKPEPTNVFPELKIYDAQGLPYRTAREDWVGARPRVQTDSGWKEWIQREQNTVEQWMIRHRDRVNWIAGWSNNFVSPKDGSKLSWTEAVPGIEVDHFSSPSDSRVEITDKLMAGWVRIWRENHAKMMLRAARLYRLTGDEKYAVWAADQLDFYATHYLEWEPQRQGARLFWQSLTEGVNLITYAHTVRLLGDYADANRRVFWHDNFFVPEVQVLNRNFPRILNITCWLRGAAAQVALIFEDEQMWREAIDGPFGIRQQISDGITSDYLWYEQSLGYNSYVVNALASLFETAGLYGRLGELELEVATVQNLMLSTAYMRFPNGHLPTVSDTKGQLTALDKDLLGKLYRVFPTSIGLKQAKGERSWNTLLDPPPTEPDGTEELPLVTSRSLESSRMAVLRDGHWQVFFHYGQPPIKSHLQAEVLNFSAYYGNNDITHDPGTVGYGSPLHRNYYTRGLNHNVPLVSGEGQEQPPKGRKPDPFTETRAGELIDFSMKPARVTAAHDVYRRDARARRTLTIDGNRLVDVALVQTTTDSPKPLGLVLHVQGNVRLPEDFKADPAFATERPKAFSYWEDVVAAAYHDKAEFDVDYDTMVIRVTFSVPGKFRVWHGSTPDTPPNRRQGFYLETIGRAATFTTMFEPVSSSRAARTH